ncbi:DMT family transporter [Acetonema longum]|uniref:EamA domain-containing protein n=1 Tax=Acetonema longum DSM 6540 TaxID=1009370 RepID=F7NFH4_9FIRM|nr:DMT family transporter [Acetonema longum]EGO65229.1 hypothetical protein ALO_04006 [Acetonema longum DSM 6540]
MQIETKFPGTDRLQGILLLLATAVLWSTGGLGIKWVDWNPLAIAGARSAISAIVIWTAFRGSPLRWNGAMVWGGAGYALMVVTFVVANKLTTAANAILLQYCSPIYVAILGAIFLREKPHLYDWLTISLVGGGMVLFFQDEMSAGGLTGNLAGIASGIGMAVMTVAMRRQKDGSPFGSALLGNILAFLCGLPFMFNDSPGVAGWVAIVAMGAIQMGLSYVLYSTAIKWVTALEATIITMIEPILNPLWVFLLLGEAPGFWSLAGGGVIMVAITFRYIIPALKSAGSVDQAGKA